MRAQTKRRVLNTPLRKTPLSRDTVSWPIFSRTREATRCLFGSQVVAHIRAAVRDRTVNGRRLRSNVTPMWQPLFSKLETRYPNRVNPGALAGLNRVHAAIRSVVWYGRIRVGIRR